MKTKKPTEIKEYPGFYYIPGKPGYGIAKDGRLIKLSSGKILKWSIRKPVPKRNVTGGYRYNRAGPRHRLLALAFLPLPEGKDDYNELVVNHINGIPGDDRLENLEWCTYSHNTKHAYDNGLHPNKVRPTLIKDFRTGEVLRFNTIKSAADYCGISPITLNGRLIRQPGARYGDFAAKYDDGTEWPEHYLKKLDSQPAVVARNVFTEKMFIFENTTDAARFIGCSQAGARKALLRGSNRPINGYVLRYLEKDITWPVFDEFQLEIIRDNPIRPISGIIATDIETGEVEFFSTWEKAIKRFNLSRAALNKRIERKQLVEDKYLLTRKLVIENES